MIDHDHHVSDPRWARLLAGDLAADARALALDHAGSCPRCAARFAELEARLAVRAALAGLPYDEARAAVHRHLDGMTLAEIAERMGRSPRQVGNLLARLDGRLAAHEDAS